MFRSYVSLIVLFNVGVNNIATQDLTSHFRNCHKKSPNFDACMQSALNQMRKYFNTGLPEYGVLPFDPHHAKYVELRRGDATGLGGFSLKLLDASEFGWAISNITKYQTDAKNNRIIYSQYFPEKSLKGKYMFNGRALGQQMNTKGIWNMTLYDYSQTTTVTRVGGPGGLLKVRVEIDRIGDLNLHISNLFGGRVVIENVADFVINAAWQPGFPFLKPMINELVSTAFTDIFNESFRNFPINKFIRN